MVEHLLADTRSWVPSIAWACLGVKGVDMFEAQSKSCRQKNCGLPRLYHQPLPCAPGDTYPGLGLKLLPLRCQNPTQVISKKVHWTSSSVPLSTLLVQSYYKKQWEVFIYSFFLLYKQFFKMVAERE